MSGLDGLSLDADGFVDMDQFPDDGTDLTDADLDALRGALHSDPIVEPTDDQWDAMFDHVVEGVDDGPFTVDDSGMLDDLGALGTDDGFDDAVSADDLSDDGADPDHDGVDPDHDLADTGGDDLDGDDLADAGFDLDDDGGIDDQLFDDGGVDLAPDDVPDDAFVPDDLDDLTDGVANTHFEDFL